MTKNFSNVFAKNLINSILKDSRHGSRSSLNADDDVESYYFFVDKWFAKDEDDRQIVRELVPTDEHGRPLIGLDGIFYHNMFQEGQGARLFIDISY
jgi:hypothetical protein